MDIKKYIYFFREFSQKYWLRKLNLGQDPLLLSVYCLKRSQKDITDTLLVAIDSSNQIFIILPVTLHYP